MKKSILGIIIFLTVVMCIFFLWNWMPENFKTAFIKLVSIMPFSKSYYSVYTTISKFLGISDEKYNALLPESSVIIVDFLKLLMSSPIIMLIRRLLSSFLLKLPIEQFEKNIQKAATAAKANDISDKLKQSLMVDESEKYFKTIPYRLKEGFIDAIITGGTILFTSFVVNKYQDNIIQFFSTKTGTVVGLILIVFFFFIYCFIFHKIYAGTFSFAIIKTLIFNIFPSILTTYISGALFYCCHMFMTMNRNFWVFLFFFILLIIWCSLTGRNGLIEKKLKVLATKYRDEYHFSFSGLTSALTIYAGYIVFAQLYSIDMDIMLQNQYMQIFFNFKGLPFYEMIMSGVKVTDNFNFTDTAYILELLKLFCFTASVSVVATLFRNLSTEFSFRGYALWTIKSSLQIGLVFIIYSLLLYVTKNDIFRMIILIAIYLVVSLILNTAHISFALTNCTLESLIIVIGEIILIYIAENISDNNFLYMPIMITEKSTINDIMTEDFVSKMIVIFVFYGLWYISDIFNWNIYKKER